MRKPGEAFVVLSGAAFALPLPFLWAWNLLDEGKFYFSIKIFFIGTFVEFFIDMALVLGTQKGALKRRSFLHLHYLNRTILGLPFTIYLALGQPLAFLVFFRILGTGLLLWRVRHVALLVWHVVFFVAGFLFYAGFQNYGWPTLREWLFLSALLLIHALLLFARRQALAAGKAFVLESRNKLRFCRRLRVLRARESSLLRLVAGRPFREARKASGFLLSIRFAGLCRIWEGAESGQELGRLQHEWDLQIDRIYKVLYDLAEELDRTIFVSCGLVSDEELLFFIEDPKQEQPSSEESAALFVYWRLKRLADDLARFRDSVLASGRSVWQHSMRLGHGELSLQSYAPDAPLPFFHGPLMRALGESRLSSGRDEVPFESPRLLLDPGLAEALRDFFYDLDKKEAWQAPGRLRPEYAQDPQGTQPNKEMQSIAGL